MRYIIGMVYLTTISVICGYGVYRTTTAQTATVQSATNAPLSFVRLAATDRMIINASVRGCYSESRYRLEYAPVPTPRITVYKDGGTTEKNWNQPLPRIGVVTLTPAQVERLNNRFHYWRATHNVGSTINEEITVKQFRDGVKVGTEAYTDSTGSIDKLDDADPRDIAALSEQDKSFADPRPVLSLYRVFEIAEQSGERNTPLPYKDIPRKRTSAYELAEEERRYAATDE